VCKALLYVRSRGGFSFLAFAGAPLSFRRGGKSVANSFLSLSPISGSRPGTFAGFSEIPLANKRTCFGTAGGDFISPCFLPPYGCTFLGYLLMRHSCFFELVPAAYSASFPLEFLSVPPPAPALSEEIFVSLPGPPGWAAEIAWIRHLGFSNPDGLGIQ